MLQLIIAWKLEKESSIIMKHVHKDHMDSDWTNIVFKIIDNKIQGGLVGAIDDSNQYILAGNFSYSNWVELVSSNPILIGIYFSIYYIIYSAIIHIYFITFIQRFCCQFNKDVLIFVHIVYD